MEVYYILDTWYVLVTTTVIGRTLQICTPSNVDSILQCHVIVKPKHTGMYKATGVGYTVHFTVAGTSSLSACGCDRPLWLNVL